MAKAADVPVEDIARLRHHYAYFRRMRCTRQYSVGCCQCIGGSEGIDELAGAIGARPIAVRVLRLLVTFTEDGSPRRISNTPLSELLRAWLYFCTT
jgi:hypothetical protein